MIEYSKLEELVLEVLKNNMENRQFQFQDILNEIAQKKGVKDHPSHPDVLYLNPPPLEPQEAFLVSQIVWDLIVQRVLTVGTLTMHEWPWLSLTEFGKAIIKDSFFLYDPDGYVENVKKLVPNIDNVILQYLQEGARCFKQGIFFASSAMLGAAAEKSILLLLDSIGKAETNSKNITQIKNLLDQPKLPSIFDLVENTCAAVIRAGKIPYKVNEGCIQHLHSFFEMIRVHRNDSVHPKFGQVDKFKIVLSLQGMPAALSVIYNLMNWFHNNKI